MTQSVWILAGFIEHLDDWIALESPETDLRLRVTSWVVGLAVDPFKGARREVEFENLWSVVIPGSIHAPQQIVFCSFWVDTLSRTVRCDQIATLSM